MVTVNNKEPKMNDKENQYFNEAVEYVAALYDISEDQVIFAYQDETEAYMKILRSLDKDPTVD
jgi:hypothetical protein